MTAAPRPVRRRATRGGLNGAARTESALAGAGVTGVTGVTEAALTGTGPSAPGRAGNALPPAGSADASTAVGPHAAEVGDEVVALLAAHVDRLGGALPALRAAAPTLARWGDDLGRRLLAGGRLLAAGNGGSAAEAQHLTAELVGRFDRDRRALSAIALHADTSSLSAIGNDYGYAQVFARQVRAHARPGDVVVLFSTSGHSPNLVEAAAAATAMDATAWALTGPGPNPLACACSDAVCLPGDTATVQEMHLAALHMLCRAVEQVVAEAPSEPSDGTRAEAASVDLPRVERGTDVPDRLPTALPTARRRVDC
jgi:phosphoheptose isomerase